MERIIRMGFLVLAFVSGSAWGEVDHDFEDSEDSGSSYEEYYGVGGEGEEGEGDDEAFFCSAEAPKAPRTPAQLKDYIKTFTTCNKKYCKDYNCRHFTKDFCKEYRTAGGELCESLSFICKNGKKSVGAGHSISFVALDPPGGERQLCAIEPQAKPTSAKGQVVACWKTKKTGSKIVSDISADALAKFEGRYDFVKKCAEDKNTMDYFPKDADVADPDKDFAPTPCCKCKKTGREYVLDKVTLYCRGACEDDGGDYVGRAKCSFQK